MARRTAVASPAVIPPVGNVYQLKITISGSKPPIWRRVLVPATSTLADLDRVIQALFGWEDEHLHQFELPSGRKDLKTRAARIAATRYRSWTDPFGEPMDSDDDSEDETTALLSVVVPEVKTHFVYTYDMGDNWEHDIVVEKILLADPEEMYPICVEGQRNDLIEDVGGIWGYEDLLEVLANPNAEDYAERRQWMKDAYGVTTWNGNAFNLAAINKRLEQLRPRKRRRPVRNRTASTEP